MTKTDRPTRSELAAEAFDDWLAERACPLHDGETVVEWHDDHVLIGCEAAGCEVAPLAAGPF